MSNTKQKTAMHEMIDLLTHEIEQGKDKLSISYPIYLLALRKAKDYAIAKLEKERQQIIDATNTGIHHGGKLISTGEQYYNETYGHDKE